MNTLLAILKVIDARRDVILAGGLNHLFAWRHLPPTPPARKDFFYYYFSVVWLESCLRWRTQTKRS